MYLNSASVLAEDRQNRTSDSYYVEEVSYRYIDERRYGKVLKEEKRDIFKKSRIVLYGDTGRRLGACFT